MTITLNGTSGIVNDATDLNYTGTLTGGTGVVNLGSGQVYKDASGNVGIGTSSPNAKLDILAATNTIRMGTSTASYATIDSNSGAGSLILNADAGNIAGGGSMQFKFAGTERARIDSSGNLLVGTTTGDGTFSVTGNSGGTYYPAAFKDNRPTVDGSTSCVIFKRINTIVGSITTTASSTAYVTSSDYRLKEAIVPMSGALARNALLNPVFYKWKVDGSEGEGFVAHELQGPFPSAVTGEKDAVDADGKPIYQGIGTGPLDGHFAACINDLQAIIQTLTARITALEGTAA